MKRENVDPRRPTDHHAVRLPEVEKTVPPTLTLRNPVELGWKINPYVKKYGGLK